MVVVGSSKSTTRTKQLAATLFSAVGVHFAVDYGLLESAAHIAI